MRKKIKKNYLIIFITCIVLVLSIIYIFFRNGSFSYTSNLTANTEYYDFSDISNLDISYSSSVLFLSDDSEVKVLDAPNNYQNRTSDMSEEIFSNPKIGNVSLPGEIVLYNGETLKLLITKSAVDLDGNLIDVVISLDNVVIWNGTTTSETKRVSLVLYPKYEFLNSQLGVETGAPKTTPDVKIGQPLFFWLDTKFANVDFHLKYFQSGTVDETTGIGTPANTIKNINTFFGDLDIPASRNSNDLSSYFLHGEEGFVPLVGKSTIYWNKNGYYDRNDVHNELQEIENGISTIVNFGTTNGRVNVNGPWYENSAFMTTEIEDNEFSFKYGGHGCGISFSFLSPYPYTYDNPSKIIDGSNDEYTSGDTFTYKVSQYIPHNYYGQIINFSEIYSNIPATTIYDNYVIEDAVSNYLTINQNNIKVVNENNVNKTNLFTISVNGQKVIATAKDSTLTSDIFYGHTYTLEIPVTVKNQFNTKFINNSAKSKINDDEARNTNTTTTTVYHNLEIKYLEAGTENELDDTIIRKVYYGDDYETSSSSQIPENYELVSTPSNANGTVGNSDIQVIYYYNEIERHAKLFNIDAETNNHLSGEELRVYDENETLIAKWITNQNKTSCNLAIVNTLDGCEVYSELLPNKTYKIVETITPNGYATSNDLTFTTDNYGNSNNITFLNYPIKVCLSVVDLNNNRVPGINVKMNKTDDTTYKSFTSSNNETCYNKVLVDDYNLTADVNKYKYEEPDVVLVNVIDTSEVQHFKVTIKKLPKITVCKYIDGDSISKKFQININNSINNFDTWLILSKNECKSVYVKPGNYKIKEVVPQEFDLIKITGINANGGTLTTEYEEEYTISFTNKFTQEGFYHSNGRAENKVTTGGGN